MDKPHVADQPHVVLYINCSNGKFRAEALFNNEAAAEAWIDQQNDPYAYSAFPLLRDSRSKEDEGNPLDVDALREQAHKEYEIAVLMGPSDANELRWADYLAKLVELTDK